MCLILKLHGALCQFSNMLIIPDFMVGEKGPNMQLQKINHVILSDSADMLRPRFNPCTEVCFDIYNYGNTFQKLLQLTKLLATTVRLSSSVGYLVNDEALGSEKMFFNDTIRRLIKDFSIIGSSATMQSIQYKISLNMSSIWMHQTDFVAMRKSAQGQGGPFSWLTM